MGRSGIIRVVQVAIVLVSLVASGTVRAKAVIGASFGYTHYSYPGRDRFANDIVAFPGSAQWAQPGLRVGYVSAAGRWEVNTDFGLMHHSNTSLHAETTVEVMPQIQVNAPVRSGYNPFVNAGVGVLSETGVITATRSVTGTRAAVGAGLGMRKSVSDGHGMVRAEVRYDHLFKSEKVLDPSSTFIFPATELYSFKLGFDLLLGK